MSASLIVLALAVSAPAELPRISGVSAAVNVRGFVPASCRVTAAAVAGCNTMMVKRLAPSPRGAGPVIVVTPLH